MIVYIIFNKQCHMTFIFNRRSHIISHTHIGCIYVVVGYGHRVEPMKRDMAAELSDGNLGMKPECQRESDQNQERFSHNLLVFRFAFFSAKAGIREVARLMTRMVTPTHRKSARCMLTG